MANVKLICFCRICCGFLGAFFVYLNRQVVLFMRRPNAMTRFLIKQWVCVRRICIYSLRFGPCSLCFLCFRWGFWLVQIVNNVCFINKLFCFFIPHPAGWSFLLWWLWSSPPWPSHPGLDSSWQERSELTSCYPSFHSCKPGRIQGRAVE